MLSDLKTKQNKTRFGFFYLNLLIFQKLILITRQQPLWGSCPISGSLLPSSILLSSPTKTRIMHVYNCHHLPPSDFEVLLGSCWLESLGRSSFQKRVTCWVSNLDMPNCCVPREGNKYITRSQISERSVQWIKLREKGSKSSPSLLSPCRPPDNGPGDWPAEATAGTAHRPAAASVSVPSGTWKEAAARWKEGGS